VYGFESVPPEEIGRVPLPEGTLLTFNFDRGIPRAIKVVGRAMSRHEIVQQAMLASACPEQLGPVIDTTTPDGTPGVAFLTGAPPGNPSQEWMLVLDVQDLSAATQSRKPAVQLLCGFDSSGIINDLSKTTTFMELSLPVDDADLKKLRKRGGG